LRIALRIEVSTERGAREGVPALLRLLDEHQVKASFCVSLGPDYSGYPFSNYLPGVLRRKLPARYISRRYRDHLKAIYTAGHDIGIASYSAVEWQRDSAYQSPEWVHSEVLHAVEAFTDLYGIPPHFHGALGWQVNANLFAEEELLKFDFASDVRGRHAFLPEMQTVRSSCPQIPTTLPTLDELLLQSEVSEENVHQFLYAECQRVLPNGEVFTLTAEREGLDLLEVLEKLLVMWKGGQWEVRPLTELLQQIDLSSLSHHVVGWAPTNANNQYMATQSTRLG
jgi:undecaprenyl phosphate-alpha-L-ara4FN deformylase